MKKSEVITEKSKKYHKKEEIEAEEILKKLDTIINYYGISRKYYQTLT